MQYNSEFLKRASSIQKIVYEFHGFCDTVAENALEYIKEETPKRSGGTREAYFLEKDVKQNEIRYAICNTNNTPEQRVVEWLDKGTAAHGPANAKFMRWLDRYSQWKGWWTKAWVKGIKPHGFIGRTKSLIRNAMGRINVVFQDRIF